MGVSTRLYLKIASLKMCSVLQGLVIKNWGEKEKSSHDTFELFWGNKLNVNEH